MTRTATDFFAGAVFRATALRATDFFAAGRFEVILDFLGDGLLVSLVFGDALPFTAFREDAFCATARFALGRLEVEPAFLRFAAAFLEGRRAAARDVERLKPLVTALMEASS